MTPRIYIPSSTNNLDNRSDQEEMVELGFLIKINQKLRVCNKQRHKKVNRNNL